MRQRLFQWRAWLVLCGATSLLGCVETAPKQSAGQSTERHGDLYSGDFDTTARPSTYGTAAAPDTRCDKPFDSASPVVMALEIVAIQEIPRVADAIAQKLGQKPDNSAQQRKQQLELLKEAAKFKVWLPVSVETLIGQELHQSLQKQGGLVMDEQLHPRDLARLQQLRKLVQKMADVLPSGQPYTFQVFATRERASSIAAQMGGFVYVSEGLLRDRSLEDADLALRLAHEISHVTKRHVLRDFQTKAVDAYTLSRQTQNDLKRMTDPTAILAMVRQRFSVVQVMARNFDHANELEADACAVRLLRHVMPDESTQRAVDNFAKQVRSNQGTAADRASHPRSELRLQVMYQQLRK